MSFNESNTVEQMIFDAVAKRSAASSPQESSIYGKPLGREFHPARWNYAPVTEIARQSGDVLVEAWVREALIRLNPEIAAQVCCIEGVVRLCTRILL